MVPCFLCVFFLGEAESCQCELGRRLLQHLSPGTSVTLWDLQQPPDWSSFEFMFCVCFVFWQAKRLDVEFAATVVLCLDDCSKFSINDFLFWTTCVVSSRHVLLCSPFFHYLRCYFIHKGIHVNMLKARMSHVYFRQALKAIKNVVSWHHFHKP